MRLRRTVNIAPGSFGAIIRLNLILCACAAPAGSLYILGLLGLWDGWASVLALCLTVPLGGVACASMYCVAQILQGSSVSIGYDFRLKFLEEWAALALPGVAASAFIFTQFYFWVAVFSGHAISIAMLILLLMSLCVFLMIAPYVLLQMAYLDIGVGNAVRNALMLSASNATRTLLGLLLGNLLWLAVLLTLPTSLLFAPVVLLFGFVMSWLANLALIWPVVDQQFRIADELAMRAAKRVEHVAPLSHGPS